MAFPKKINIAPTSNGDIRRIAFVGLDKAGKTTTAKRLSKGILVRTRPTHGFNAETFTFMGVRFNVFDLGGQISYQIFWEKFLPQQEAVVFFVDAADRHRLAQVRLALNRTLSLLQPDTTLMILANKQDLPDALTVDDLLKHLDLGMAPKARQLQIFPTSALTGMGIYDAFQWLTGAMNIGIGDQQCNLYGFYVYEKNVGIPILASGVAERTEEYLVNLETPVISHDPALITALHSAIGNFTREVAESELKSVRFQAQKTGQIFQIISIRQEDLVCILITSEEDNEIITGTLGEAILQIVHEKRNRSSFLVNDFEMSEVLDIIAPFVRNIDDYKQRPEPVSPGEEPSISQDQALDLSASKTGAPELSSKEIHPPSSLEISPKDKNGKKIAEPPVTPTEHEDPHFKKDEKSTFTATPSSSSPKIVQETRKPPSPTPPREQLKKPRPSQPSSDTRPKLTPPPKEVSQQEKSETTKKDDNFFFHLGVAERIKYLQEQRKREREALSK
ncbi:MAG: ADP-ribosylation factor-like protein [Candidatus Hodarchaeota archaeon]